MIIIIIRFFHLVFFLVLLQMLYYSLSRRINLFTLINERTLPFLQNKN